MMDINPIDLRYFLEVSQSLNISRAAERLNVGQSTISQAIQRVEGILGVPVFDRFKTGVQLTTSGKKLVSEGRAALEGWDRMKLVSQSAEMAIEGRYSLGCHTAVAMYALPKFMRSLLGENPGLEINLKHGLSREIVADVISFKTDFGIVMNPIRHPDLVIKNLCEDKVSLWRTPKTLEDTLIFDPVLSQSQTLLKKLEKSLKIKRHLTSGSLEVIALLAAEGSGIAILPERIAQLYPTLRPVSKASPIVQDKLALIYRADRTFNAAAKVITSSIMAAKF